MAQTAASYMAKTLHKAGVKRVYGIVGDSLNGFTDALRQQKAIDWIHMRHEEGAAFAAAAEAHLTGKLAVCSRCPELENSTILTVFGLPAFA